MKIYIYERKSNKIKENGVFVPYTAKYHFLGTGEKWSSQEGEIAKFEGDLIDCKEFIQRNNFTKKVIVWENYFDNELGLSFPEIFKSRKVCQN